MPPDKGDAAYLWDIVDAGRAITRFCRGKSLPEYLGDELLQAAVERKIEIIGEAARNVSDEFRLAHPEIPWRTIVGQRHVLAHDYGDIKQDRVWSVVSVHVPELLKAFEPLVPPLPESAP